MFITYVSWGGAKRMGMEWDRERYFAVCDTRPRTKTPGKLKSSTLHYTTVQDSAI